MICPTAAGLSRLTRFAAREVRSVGHLPVVVDQRGHPSQEQRQALALLGGDRLRNARLCGKGLALSNFGTDARVDRLRPRLLSGRQ